LASIVPTIDVERHIIVLIKDGGVVYSHDRYLQPLAMKLMPLEHLTLTVSLILMAALFLPSVLCLGKLRLAEQTAVEHFSAANMKAALAARCRSPDDFVNRCLRCAHPLASCFLARFRRA